jgi:hypothetical protein
MNMKLKPFYPWEAKERSYTMGKRSGETPFLLLPWLSMPRTEMAWWALALCKGSGGSLGCPAAGCGNNMWQQRGRSGPSTWLTASTLAGPSVMDRVQSVSEEKIHDCHSTAATVYRAPGYQVLTVPVWGLLNFISNAFLVATPPSSL